MSLKEPTPNELIPVLIKKFSEYSNKIKDRIKIDEIFSEFNLNAHNEFNKFIKMSQNRYKSVKSGNTLENVIFKSYEELHSKIVDISNIILKNNENLSEEYEINEENLKIYLISNSENSILSLNWNGLKTELLNSKSTFFILNRKEVKDKKIFRFIVELNKKPLFID